MHTDALNKILSLEAIRTHRIIPLGEEDGVLSIGTAQPLDPGFLRDLAFWVGKTIVPVEVDAREIENFIHANPDAGPFFDKAGLEGQQGRVPFRGSGSVIGQIDALIYEAIDQRASDIHIEPGEKRFRVRYRLDGVLHEVGTLALRQKDALVSRLKIMAALDIAEKRRPQDGRIRVEHAGRGIDLRVSTLPTDFGEKVVLRILDKSGLNLAFGALGFSELDQEAVRRAIHMPGGMILVTGPTGSGKTTTLYAALNTLNTPHVNITTIEDPIEYNLEGINQTHVRPDIGLTFARALRAFLRQDPDIVMVGEMRDKETVDIAIRAALTGHLVLSTIHTNDAPSTVVRLMDMSVEPFLVSASVRMVIAQRLVRKICTACKTETRPAGETLIQLGLQAAPHCLFAGAGCPACHGTGYRGRTALFEVMPVTEQLAKMIAQRASMFEIRQQARAEGMRTLRDVSIEKMLNGVTTVEEVLRETTL